MKRYNADIPFDEDEDAEDCGESLTLTDDEAKAKVLKYNQELESRFMFRRDVPGRHDPRSILHGL
jgi:hypothetical protein